MQRTCDRFGLVYLGGEPAKEDPSGPRERAAARYGTPDLAAQLAGGAGKTAPQWQNLAQRDATIETTTGDYRGESPPEDTLRTAYAATRVQRVADYPDGASKQLQAGTIFCTLSRPDTDSGWLVNEVQLSMGAQK